MSDRSERGPLHVYIAGPLGAREDWADNVRRACEAADWVVGQGHVPFIPHLSVAWVGATADADERHYEDWMRWCLAWVERCDVVLRLPGESRGADREVEHARSNGVCVIQGRSLLAAWLPAVHDLWKAWIREGSGGRDDRPCADLAPYACGGSLWGAYCNGGTTDE